MKSIKVLYSNDIFSSQFVGGISRYIYELHKKNTSSKIPIIYAENLYLKGAFKTPNFKGKHRLILFLNNLLEKYYLRFDIEIYHLSYYKNTIKPKNTKIMIVSVYDMIHEIYAKSYFKHDTLTSKLKLSNCKNADGIIAISHQTKRDLIRIFGIEESKIKVIYLGHSLKKIHTPLVFEKSFKDYILFVGSRSGYKNFKNFALAISLLPQKINVICIGSPFSESEKSFLSSLCIQERFKSYNAKDEELYTFYHNAKCFVFPSFYEGFGIPILEAFFASCVCLLSDIEVFREIACECAMYFDPNLPQNIADCIMRALNDEALVKDLKIKATRRLQDFSWDKTARETQDFYQMLLAKNTLTQENLAQNAKEKAILQNAQLKQKEIKKESTMKKALIIGANGQDGYFLMQLLESKGYEVHIMVRHQPCNEDFSFVHYDDLYFHKTKAIIYHYGDITDSNSIFDILSKVKPYEIYNLAGISNVKISFSLPQNTADSIALGTIRILETIKSMKLNCRFYNACSSEIYGDTTGILNEESTFNPKSPYAIAKLYAFYMVKHYREAYNLFAVSGILFNHESHLRRESFVSKKIIKAAVLIANRKQKILYLGNLDSKRDFGYAKDYVECMYLMMQSKTPKDYVIATGKQHSIREFCQLAFQKMGITIKWQGSGIDEVGINEATNEVLIKINPNYFRPLDIESSRGDSSKAQDELNWNPNQTSFHQLIETMLEKELQIQASNINNKTSIQNNSKTLKNNAIGGGYNLKTLLHSLDIDYSKDSKLDFKATFCNINKLTFKQDFLSNTKSNKAKNHAQSTQRLAA